MIPVTNNDLQIDVEIAQQPTLTYKMDLENMRIPGLVDGVEAIKQTIYKIMNTERYDEIIYSWEYGVEFVELFGEPSSFAIPEIKRRVTEALVQDERITSVDEFTFTSTKGQVSVQFTVHTSEGDIDIGKVVNL